MNIIKGKLCIHVTQNLTKTTTVEQETSQNKYFGNLHIRNNKLLNFVLTNVNNSKYDT